MLINGVDPKITSRKLKKLKRQSKRDATRMSTSNNACPIESQLEYSEIYGEELTENTSFDSNNSVVDPNFVPTSSTLSSRNMAPLPNLALACDRTGVSNRSAAIISSAILEDIGLINSSDSSCVVDRSKLKRQRIKSRAEQIKKASKKESSIRYTGLYFDGKKDECIAKVNRGNFQSIKKSG